MVKNLQSEIEDKMIVGIDLGGMSAKAALFSQGKLSEKCSVATSAKNSPEETALALAQLSRKAAETAGCSFDEVQAIGIGSPGVVDSDSGTVALWSNFAWNDVPLASYVERYTGKRVFVLNDANAAAYGEAKYGAGKGYENSLLITIGTGIGGGIVLGGKLFEGYRSAGTEVGHMIIRQNGELCTCGRRGCFERYASARALVSLTQEAMRSHPQSALWRFASSVEQADGRTVFDALKEKDAAAQNVFREYIAALGEGIVNLVNLLRPQAVILGGGIAAEGETLLAPLREFVYSGIYISNSYAPLTITAASLGNDAGIYGAAQFAVEQL